METEFHGGEGVDPDGAEDELFDAVELSSPLFVALAVQHWSRLLSRDAELEAVPRPGPKREEVKQMKAFEELFHSELRSLLPSNDEALQQLQCNHSSSSPTLSAAPGIQDAIMKHLKRMGTIVGEAVTDDIVDPSAADGVMHNLHQHQRECEWIDLADALRGPAHVAKVLIRQCQGRRSTLERQ